MCYLIHFTLGQLNIYVIISVTTYVLFYLFTLGQHVYICYHLDNIMYMLSYPFTFAQYNICNLITLTT